MLDQLRRNAEVNDLENLLKKDAAISYKLLRYINSAGFGMRSEVQSLRHAVSLIGYTPLYRWLTLMLATSSTDESAAILMQTAIIRGRIVELLGDGNFSKAEQQNMFVMGMFSLLDRLLGVPMEEALKHNSIVGRCHAGAGVARRAVRAIPSRWLKPVNCETAWRVHLPSRFLWSLPQSTRCIWKRLPGRRTSHKEYITFAIKPPERGGFFHFNTARRYLPLSVKRK